MPVPPTVYGTRNLSYGGAAAPWPLMLDVTPPGFGVDTGFELITAHLIGFFLTAPHGGDVSRAARNLVKGQPHGALVGTPVEVNDFHLRFDAGTAWLQTEFPDPVQGTYVVVGRDPGTGAGAATSAQFIGNRTAGTNSGAALTRTAAVQFTVVFFVDPAAPVSIVADLRQADGLNPATMNDWKVLIAEFGPDWKLIRSMTDGAQKFAANTGAPRERVQGENPVCIGGGLNSQQTGFVDIAAAMIFDDIFHDGSGGGAYPAEWDTIYAYLKTLLDPRLGVTL